MGLTAKQEKFCQGVVKGMSYSDAYREAYEAGQMKPETFNRKAKELANNGKIRTRLAEFRGKIEEELKYSAVESFRKLLEIQEKALAKKKILQGRGEDGTREVEDPDFNSALRAEELKGKLANLYKDVKDVTLKGPEAFVAFYEQICEKKDYVK